MTHACVACHDPAGTMWLWEDWALCDTCALLPRAVSLLVEGGTSHCPLYLAVSRKDDHSKFGLPGGKVEPKESLLGAIIREVREETGLEIAELNHLPCFVGVCRGGKDGIAYLNVAYTARRVYGSIRTDEPHVVEWVTRDKLFAGPFGAFNRALFAHLYPTQAKAALVREGLRDAIQHIKLFSYDYDYKISRDELRRLERLLED